MLFLLVGLALVDFRHYGILMRIKTFVLLFLLWYRTIMEWYWPRVEVLILFFQFFILASLIPLRFNLQLIIKRLVVHLIVIYLLVNQSSMLEMGGLVVDLFLWRFQLLLLSFINLVFNRRRVQENMNIFVSWSMQRSFWRILVKHDMCNSLTILGIYLDLWGSTHFKFIIKN